MPDWLQMSDNWMVVCWILFWLGVWNIMSRLP